MDCKRNWHPLRAHFNRTDPERKACDHDVLLLDVAMHDLIHGQKMRCQLHPLALASEDVWFSRSTIPVAQDDESNKGWTNSSPHAECGACHPSCCLRMEVLQSVQTLLEDYPPPVLTHRQALIMCSFAQLGQITSKVGFVDQVEEFAVLEDLLRRCFKTVVNWMVKSLGNREIEKPVNRAWVLPCFVQYPLWFQDLTSGNVMHHDLQTPQIIQ